MDKWAVIREAQLLELFHALSPAEQLECITLIAAHFSEQIRKMFEEK